MAKIISEKIVISFSKIAKDSDSGASVVSEEIQAALEQVAQELVGETVVVEVERVQ